MADAFTLKRMIEGRIEALRKLPVKEKSAYATDLQISSFNKLRADVATVPGLDVAQLPPEFQTKAGVRGAAVGGAKYADIMTALSDLLVCVDLVQDDPPAPSMG